MMGQEDSGRRRPGGEILEELLERVSASEQRTLRIIEDMVAQQTQAQRALRSEFEALLARQRQDSQTLLDRIDSIDRLVRSRTDAAEKESRSSPPETSPGELHRLLTETREQLATLDHSLAASLAVFGERLEALAGQIERKRRRAQQGVAPPERGTARRIGEADREPASASSAARIREGPEIDSEGERPPLPREWGTALAALQHQVSELRTEQERQWRAVEHRLQDLEHLLTFRARSSRPAAAWLAAALFVLAAGALSAYLLWQWGERPAALSPAVKANQPELPGGAPSSARNGPQSWLARAEKAMTAGNAVAAERALREGVRLYPDDLLLRLRLALLLVEQRRLDSAREQLSEALRIDPQSFEARQLLARIDAERIIASPLQSSTAPAVAETEKNARSRERPVGGERVREGDQSPSTVRNEVRRDEGWGDEWDDWESP